jgi:hypothetical protein
MMSEAERIYYRRRAAEEEMAARRATTVAAANAHRVLAEHYASLIEEPVSIELAQGASAMGS